MQPETLSYQSIAEVDGGVIEVAFNQALQQVINDLRDRPTLDKKRSVTLQLDLTPIADHGHLSRTDIEFSVKPTLPPKKSNPYPFKAAKVGLTFFPDIADNPDQRPLPFGHNSEDED